MDERRRNAVRGTTVTNRRQREHFTYDQLRHWKDERDQVLNKRETNNMASLKEPELRQLVQPEPGQVDKDLPEITNHEVARLPMSDVEKLISKMLDMDHLPKSDNHEEVTTATVSMGIADHSKSDVAEVVAPGNAADLPNSFRDGDEGGNSQLLDLVSHPEMELGHVEKVILENGDPNKGVSVKEAGEARPAPVPKAKAKKPKGMQFDAVFKEFNGYFVAESSALSDYSEHWAQLVEVGNGSIPDEIIGEIESAVGQAKLLLESKLPQFFDLLYFYLSRTVEPHPTLPCDLEGWWAVAMLSIDKVKDRFVQLEKLKHNGWVADTKARRWTA